MRIYLDTSVYKRPFDDQTQARIWLETLALAIVFQLLETTEIELVTSSVVAYENSRDPLPMRRKWGRYCNGLAGEQQKVDEAIRKRAASLAEFGLAALDALHIAAAEAADCDYCLTCDDRFLKRAQGHTHVQVCNPVEFVMRVTGEATV
jgi:predicted nucleic acid-binding protein